MSTYLELQQRVSNDYLNRSDYGSEVKRAILASVRFYERRRWRFNETSTALTTSAGQSTLALPSNFLVVDQLRLTYAGFPEKLKRDDLDNIIQMRGNSSSTGVPTHYTIYGEQFELAVIPDSAYSCPLYYIKSLTELSADADTNSWTTGLAQDVIVYRAAKLMWANVIRNDREAAKFAALEKEALTELQSEFEQFELREFKPTEF